MNMSENPTRNEKVSPFEGAGGKLPEMWRAYDVLDQERILEALNEITGEDTGAGICSFISDEHADIFNNHLRNYLAEGSSADLKEVAADAVIRMIKETEN
jgi:hypothetical protein